MKQLVFSVFDVKAGAFMQPFFVPTIGVATRSFMETVIDPEHAFRRWPEDYKLMHLGEFDDSSGELIPCKQPAHVVSASEVLQQMMRRHAADASGGDIEP